MAVKDLSGELSAMQAIVQSLDGLDQPTRTRVLHWIQERFQDDAPSGVTAAPAPSPVIVAPVHATLHAVAPPANATDEGLSVSNLTDFFERCGPAAAPDPASLSIPGLLRDFVAEFQDLAREWNADGDPAADEPLAAPLLSVAS